MYDLNSEKPQTAYLLGIGLDSEKGPFRVTRGEDFQILGGSERTHRRMQEKILHLEEELSKEGRSIGGLEADEFEDVARILKEG